MAAVRPKRRTEAVTTGGTGDRGKRMDLNSVREAGGTGNGSGDRGIRRLKSCLAGLGSGWRVESPTEPRGSLMTFPRSFSY